MTTGIVVKPDPAAANAVDDAIAQASGASHRGVRQVWLNQRFDVDALTLAAVTGGRPFPVYVAAMGPRALRAAGELADGTVTYLAGPRTIEEFIAPTLARAAADASRPPPRIIALVPVAVTNNSDAARADAAKALHFYDQFPSNQKIMAREGVTHAADLAVIGDPDSAVGQLLRYRSAGAADMVLSPFQTEPSALPWVWALAAGL